MRITRQKGKIESKRYWGSTIFWDTKEHSKDDYKWITYSFLNINLGLTGFFYENLWPHELSKILSLGIIEFYWGWGSERS
jgi:hypothetical protein